MSDASILDPAAAYALWAADYPPLAHNPLMQAEERALLGLLPRDLRGRDVLDAGCGSGRYLLHAGRRGARRVLGVDLSAEMLARAQTSGIGGQGSAGEDLISDAWLIRASLDAIPIRDGWADMTICGLTLGHLEDLSAALAELHRVTCRGGTLLCSDFHPIGHVLGWRREFSAAGRRYGVRYTPHLQSEWQRASRALGLEIVQILEPSLDPADIPAGARFDQVALEIPVALVFEMRRRT